MLSVLKRFRNLISFFIVFLFLMIPGFGTSSARGVEKAKWSIFIYLCGTDLETYSSHGTNNLNQLLGLEIPDDVNIIVTTGGTEEWNIEGIDPNKLQRFQIKSGELVLLEEEQLENMGDSRTLSDFLTWGVNKFPAEKNMVVLWNHGDGSVNGVIFDQIYDDNLTLSELGNALKTTNFKFDIIGFDTCLAANLETASQVKDYGTYMIASQEIEPGEGWDYATWGGAICENPDISPFDLSKVVADSFFANEVDKTFDGNVTFSIIDLNKITKVEESFDKLALELSKSLTDLDKLRSVYAALEKAETYGASSMIEGFSGMKDLGHFVRNAEHVIGEVAVNTYNTIDDAVVYNLSGDAHPNASGISFYANFADSRENYNQYSYGSKSAEYLAFLDAVSHVWTAPDWVYEKTERIRDLNFKDYILQYTSEIKDNNTFSVTVSNAKDSIYKVYPRLSIDGEDGGYIRYDVKLDIESSEDGSVFEAQFTGKTLTINGIPIFAETVTASDDHIIYAIPIELNGETTSLRVKYDSNSKKYEVLGAWKGLIYDDMVSSRVFKEVKDGDVIAPLLPRFYYDEKIVPLYYKSPETVVVAGELEFSEQSLPDGEYDFLFNIVNILGRNYSTDIVSVRIKDGEIDKFEFPGRGTSQELNSEEGNNESDEVAA